MSNARTKSKRKQKIEIRDRKEGQRILMVTAVTVVALLVLLFFIFQNA